MHALVASLSVLAASAPSNNSTAQWLATRRAMIKAARGADGLPTQSKPDAIHPLGPEHNTPPGVEALVWNMSGMFEITSTVFYSPARLGERSKEAFLFHHGHSDCNCGEQTDATCTPECGSSMRPGWPGHSWWDLYNVSSFFHSMGHDVFILSMPLKGVNRGNQKGAYGPYGNWTGDHWWFLQWEQKGDHPLRYYLDPIFMTANYAEASGYERLHIAGLSGGGWSTTVAAAMDPRFHSSFPIAGSLPGPMRTPDLTPHGHDYEDFEQDCTAPDPRPIPPLGCAGQSPSFVPPKPGTPIHCPGRPMYQACNYTCMYLLAGLEPERFQMQILHDRDDCCFAVRGRHWQVRQYEAAVRAELGQGAKRGWFTAVTDNHTHHEVCPRDKTLLRTAHVAGMAPGDDRWDRLPCDVLHTTGGDCPTPDLPPDAPPPAATAD